MALDTDDAVRIGEQGHIVGHFDVQHGNLGDTLESFWLHLHGDGPCAIERGLYVSNIVGPGLCASERISLDIAALRRLHDVIGRALALYPRIAQVGAPVVAVPA
jgi:hypothetical protein